MPVRPHRPRVIELAAALTLAWVLGIALWTYPHGSLSPEGWPAVVASALVLVAIWALAVLILVDSRRTPTVAQLQAMAPDRFEAWVAGRFRRLGYRVRVTAMSGDHGADLVVEKDGELAIVQCKRYRSAAVGEPVLRDLYGAMHDFGAARAFLVTTGKLTDAARAWAIGKPLVVWDRDKLEHLDWVAAHPEPPGA